jgi:tetratricopeptide (TPR) repeat protein
MGRFDPNVAAKRKGAPKPNRMTRRLTLRGFPLLVIAAFGVTRAPAAAAERSAPRQTTTGPSSTDRSPYAEAETLFREGSVGEAKQRIAEQLRQNPRSVEGYNLLGIIYTSEGNYAQALDAFQQALGVDPKSARTRNNIGNVYVAQQNLALAEQEFRKVLQLEPSNSDANYNLGLVLLAKGAPAQAIAYFQRVRPSNNATRLNLTRAYFGSGRNAEALKTAAEASSQSKEDVQLHFTLGVLLAGEKQYKAAQAELEKANALSPDTFEILYNLGQIHLRNAEYDKAEFELGRALRRKPDSPETLYLLAQAYSEQKKSVDALDLLVRAHKLAPQNADITFLLARVSMTQNYFEDAIPLLESGLQLAPERADLRAALGESYFMSGKAEKAIDEFKTLIQVDPSARSYAFMGLSYRHLGRFDEARKYFEAGLKLDPHNASCLFNMGYIEERQGNHARAEVFLRQALRYKPDLSEALLELANLRIENKKFEEAAELLRKYVKLSKDPAAGYYKLAMVERSLHQTEAAQRDLNVFQTLSKNAAPGPYPYQHLLDYVDTRSNLSERERAQLDLTQLNEEIGKHPDQPQNLYLLAEAYLKLGKVSEARQAVAQLDQFASADFRTQTGVGVLLARYRLYDDAIGHFRSALAANPDSDDIKFDLADAYFRKRLYNEALEISSQVSERGRQDDAFLSLLGDIHAHLGNAARASEIFRDAIRRNPDNDQYYLSLALVELRGKDVDGAAATLRQGLARIPGSGKILWGLGIVSVLEGKTGQAEKNLERAVDLLPEWPGSYSTLGIFYYQTGEIDKAREVLNRFKGSNASNSLDVNRIEEALARAPERPSTLGEPMPAGARQQFLQMALSLADRTL